jgi:hypothetical protein
MSTSDPAATYERLKAETAEMLKLDAGNLSLVEGLQLDLVSLLRLEVDSLQGAALAGEKTDLQRLAVAHGMLAKLLPTVSAPPAADQHDFSGALQELDELFNKRLAALDRRMAMFPQRARDEFEETLARAIAKYPDVSNPASSFARYGAVSPPVPVEQPLLAAGGCELPEVLSTVEQTPPPALPQQTSPQPPLPPPDAPIPQHYLRGEPEPWRPFVDESGIHTSPWRRY